MDVRAIWKRIHKSHVFPRVTYIQNATEFIEHSYLSLVYTTQEEKLKFVLRCMRRSATAFIHSSRRRRFFIDNLFVDELAARKHKMWCVCMCNKWWKLRFHRVAFHCFVPSLLLLLLLLLLLMFLPFALRKKEKKHGRRSRYTYIDTGTRLSSGRIKSTYTHRNILCVNKTAIEVMHIHSVYVCVQICVCVFVRKGENERNTHTKHCDD